MNNFYDFIYIVEIIGKLNDFDIEGTWIKKSNSEVHR